MSDLLDIIAANEAKDEAITRVGTNADPQWLGKCYNMIVAVATVKQRFTSDDVWWALDHAEIDAPHEPRALGSVIRQVCKDGLIKPTSEYRPSQRATCHARPLRVWISA